MSPQEQRAYDEARRRIEACRLSGKEGTTLDLSGLRLTALPSQISLLSALTQLDLRSNKLTALPPGFGELSALKQLDLRANEFKTLPPEISQLSALTKLDLDGNGLIALPPEIGHLSQLRLLYLTANELIALPPEIATLTKLDQLYLHENSALGLPPEVLGPKWRNVRVGNEIPASPAAILDYYFSIHGSAGQALREVKLILVGRGEVGKSTLADVLRGQPFVKNRPRTDGITITPWPVMLPDGAAKVMLWDFGGQEIMHGTHQFFLTHRSLYVVMVDGRHDRAKQDAEYWLKLVRAFGGESPVLVAMNRQKAHPFDVDRQYLADKYGVALDHFFRTDCERAADLVPLHDAILAERRGCSRSRNVFRKSAGT